MPLFDKLLGMVALCSPGVARSSTCRPHFQIGFSALSVSHYGSENNTESAVVLGTAQCLSPNISLAEQITATYALDSGDDRVNITIAVEWKINNDQGLPPESGGFVIPSRYFDPTAIRLRAGLGPEVVDSSKAKIGGVAQLGLQWLPFQGADYELGVEVRMSYSYVGDSLWSGGVFIIAKMM